MSTINPHTTRAAGTILTAAIYNADHVNHITNSQALNADKLEGATPPVVDGHAVLWLGTSGAALKSAGFAPASAALVLTAGAGLTGGGDLSANRTLAVDPETQAGAEGATNNVKAMTALRVRQLLDHTNAKASQAEAEAAANDTKWLSPLRVRQLLDHANAKASQAEAQAGTNNTKWMSPLRTAEAIAALAPVEVKAFAKGGSGSGADLQTRCSVSGTLSKTVTLSPAAPHTNYVVLLMNDTGDSASGVPINTVTTSGFSFPTTSGARWSLVVIW